MNKISTIILLTIIYISANAQNVENTEFDGDYTHTISSDKFHLRLDYVKFCGDMEIVLDDGSPMPNLGVDFSSTEQYPELVPNGVPIPYGSPQARFIEQSFPVAYVSGSHPTATAAFRSSPNPNYTQQLWIRGITSNANNEKGSTQEFTFPKQLVMPDNEGYYIYKEDLADQPLPINEVDYFQKFNIIWQVSETGDDWHTVAKSYNLMFVTYGENLTGHPWRFSEIANFCMAGASR